MAASSLFLSSDVGLQVKLLVQQLHGSVPAMLAADPPLTYSAWLAEACGVAPNDLSVTAQLVVHGRVFGLPERTFSAAGSKLRWNEWLTFTEKYSDLSADARVEIRVYGSAGPRASVLLGSASAPLFDERQQLIEGDVTLRFELAAEHCEPGAGAAGCGAGGGGEDEAEMGALEAMAAKHEETLAAAAQPGLGWLDRPTYQLIEARQRALESRLSRHQLSIRLPAFEYPVVFHQRSAAAPPPPLQQLPPPPAGRARTALQTPRQMARAAAAGRAAMDRAAAAAAEAPAVVSARSTPRAPAESGRETSIGFAEPIDPPADGSESEAGIPEGGTSAPLSSVDSASLFLVTDGEIGRDSPSLVRHHRLARSLLSAGFARELKPDSEERRRLVSLVALPPTTRMREEERELVWKFRYALTDSPRALTKLLKCVDWSDPRESAHARQIAERWAPPDIGDLLELLGPSFVSAPAWVRQCAVDALRARATDAQLVAYLLPLVQAVQYERVLSIPAEEAPLASLLIERALASVNQQAAHAPHHAARKGPRGHAEPPPAGMAGSGGGAGLGDVGAFLGGVAQTLSTAMRESIGGGHVPAGHVPAGHVPGGHVPAGHVPGAVAGRESTGGGHVPVAVDGARGGEAYADEAGVCSELATSFHWYMSLESREPRHAQHYGAIHQHFLSGLSRTRAGADLRRTLRRQEALVGALSAAAQSVKSGAESRPKKIARLRSMFDFPSGGLAPLRHLDAPLRMPLDPKAIILGALPHESVVFKSALSPIAITFRARPQPPPEAGAVPLDARAHDDARAGAADGSANDNANASLNVSAVQNSVNVNAAAAAAAADADASSTYGLIIKTGDDLRQDQMVLAMLRLMDNLLQQQGLDLALTPYRVLATGPAEGIVERVRDCLPLADILKENKGDIRRYLAQYHPNTAAPYGIEPEVLERFVKSCAGYCVAMYVMGVGDRHLDNLMLRADGGLFHIDFGYILGRDPKPFPPPMKLCKEMVEAMGGADSRMYERFRVLCCEAFNILRASSNLILNLLLLMVDAGVADLKGEQDVLKVAEKLRLDLSDEEAALYFQDLISESVSSLFPQINETIHRWAQYWRS